jgi:hypothetical protein
MRRIFVLMNEVMQRTGWSYPQMMLCIYGLAGAHECTEEWVENWLERQLVLCEKNSSLLDEIRSTPCECQEC